MDVPNGKLGGQAHFAWPQAFRAVSQIVPKALGNQVKKEIFSMENL